jgi:hypothetical protein
MGRRLLSPFDTWQRALFYRYRYHRHHPSTRRTHALLSRLEFLLSLCLFVQRNIPSTSQDTLNACIQSFSSTIGSTDCQKKDACYCLFSSLSFIIHPKKTKAASWRNDTPTHCVLTFAHTCTHTRTKSRKSYRDKPFFTQTDTAYLLIVVF